MDGVNKLTGLHGTHLTWRGVEFCFWQQQQHLGGYERFWDQAGSDWIVSWTAWGPMRPSLFSWTVLSEYGIFGAGVRHAMRQGLRPRPSTRF